MASSSSSPSSRNWSYDVFPSFSGEDVRNTFLSHFLKELDRKLIIAFKDNEIERSQSLDPELTQAIKDSRIAVVIFSKNYASSSWCLNELLEIVKCKKECGQVVIPVFYGLDPSDVRKQTGDFGKIFEKTCENKTEDKITLWRGALTYVANILGFHIVTWANEAIMIEEIADDVLGKLNLNRLEKFEDFVGTEDHMRAMSSLLHLESEEVRMVGIWGPSGIGKTTIARALFNRLSRHFQGSVFTDKIFVSKSTGVYGGATLVDYNVKLHLQRCFLAEMFNKKDIKIEHLGGAMENMLRHRKVLIFIDDLDDQDVLDALAGSSQWFGSGSRIIVVTKDKQFLRAHGIEHIYEVCLPSKDLALEMFCRSAFRNNSPPDGFMKLASEVVYRAGNLPLGLHVLGSNLRGRDKEDWMDMLPSLRNGLDGKIDKTLKVSYDGLKSEDKSIFRHIACLFNGKEVNYIKMLLADSNLDVNIGLQNLVDKSLIHVRHNIVEMHSLLQKMGIEIVRSQSNEPGEREFLVDPEEICAVIKNNTGTKVVLGITLDMNKIDELIVHKNAFEGMPNLQFLDVRALMPKSFNYLPPKLKYLRWTGYPMRCLPSNFRPENLVKLVMHNSKLEKLWKGVVSLTCLTEIDLHGSRKLKKIPDLSEATNLQRLFLAFCSNLLELPSSIRNLKKLRVMDMKLCGKLKTIPTGIYLNYLESLDLFGCWRLRSVPKILNNISKQHLTQTTIEESPSNFQQPFTPIMTRLALSFVPNLVELPSSFQNLQKLKHLLIMDGKNLETLPTGINLQSLELLYLSRCSRLRSFPNISRNIVVLRLDETAIEEVPWWIENFSRLSELNMRDCKNLRRVSLNILKLKHLKSADFSNCKALTEARWDESLSVVAMTTDNIQSRLPDEAYSYLPEDYISVVRMFEFISCLNIDPTALLQQQTAFMTTDNIHSRLPDKASSSLPDDYISMALFDFFGCLKFDPKALLQQETVGMGVILSGEEVPSNFTHRNIGDSLTNILLPHISPSQPFLRFKACALFDVKYNGIMPEDLLRALTNGSIKIQVCFRFIDISGNHFDYADLPREFSLWGQGGHLVIFDCCFPLNKDITPLANQLDYDRMDIQFRLVDKKFGVQLKGCGIQIPEIEQSQECGGGAVESNPDTLSHVCQTDVDNVVNDGCHETVQSVQFVGSDEETARYIKQMNKLNLRESLRGWFCGF